MKTPGIARHYSLMSLGEDIGEGAGCQRGIINGYNWSCPPAGARRPREGFAAEREQRPEQNEIFYRRDEPYLLTVSPGSRQRSSITAACNSPRTSPAQSRAV